MSTLTQALRVFEPNTTEENEMKVTPDYEEPVDPELISVNIRLTPDEAAHLRSLLSVSPGHSELFAALNRINGL